MKLSTKALTELKKTLEKEIGLESVLMLNEDQINDLGVLFLSIFAESLKMKAISKKDII
jgi:hypothetical protein